MQGLPAAGPEEATHDEEDEPGEAPEEMVKDSEVSKTMLTWLILSLSSTAGTVLSTAKRPEAAAGTTEGVSGTLRTVECTEEVFVTAAGRADHTSIRRSCIGQDGWWSVRGLYVVCWDQIGGGGPGD